MRFNRVDPVWPALVALAGPAVLIFASAVLGPDFLWVLVGIPAVAIVWWVTANVGAALAVHRCVRREWSRAAWTAVLPAAALLAAFDSLALVRWCHQSEAIVHFQLSKSAYVSRVQSAAGGGRPKLLVFSRGGWLGHSEGIVYDESDEILLPDERRSARWNAQAGWTELSCNVVGVPLGDHFYLGSFDC